MGVVKFLTAMGLFIGQTPAFFELMGELAAEADNARRRIGRAIKSLPPLHRGFLGRASPRRLF
jgi:hypothetical protein